jgi:prepilin peptidase CpaA
MPAEFAVFLGSPLKAIAGVLFFGLLAGACVYDVRTRRIPNQIVAALLACGLAFSLLATPGGIRGLGFGLGGLLVGLALWLPSWLFRLLGAGDVKLYAAASAWLGMRGALNGAICAAFVGGLVAVIWMLRYRGLRGSAMTFWAAAASPKSLVQPVVVGAAPTRMLPYSVALAAGAALAACIPHIVF